jgi:hypothetical protein
LILIAQASDMALHPLFSPRIARPESPSDRTERLEDELAAARSILQRLLEAEDRIGLVYPVMDDARRWLARTKRG